MLFALEDVDFTLLPFIAFVFFGLYTLHKFLNRNPEIRDEAGKGIVNKIERWFK